MITEYFLDSDGVRLHYLDCGSAGRPIVLLAGLGDSAQVYRRLAPKLIDRLKVLGTTPRGHGRSERPDSGYDQDTLVEDIRRLLDKMGVVRPITGRHGTKTRGESL